MNTLKIEQLRGAQALPALREQWQALFCLTKATPFLSWEWMSAWQRWFGHHGTPRLLCVREGSALVGLLPLYEGEGPRSVRRLSFLGEDYVGADYLDALALPGREREVADALFRHLAKDDSFDLLELKGLAEDSFSLASLIRHFGAEAKFGYQQRLRDICPKLVLRDDWDEVLSRSKRADNYRRRLRQLRALTGLERRVITEPELAAEAFDRFLALHERRWAAQGGSEAMWHPAVKGFHRDVVVRLARLGLLRFEELWVEGACRASIYGFDDGHRFCFYQTGYDPSWSRHSVGLVCLGLSIEDAVKRGVKFYNFLRGTERYKFDWANDTRNTMAVRVTNGCLPVRWLIAREHIVMAVQEVAQAVLPEQVVKLLRRKRRAWIARRMSSIEPESAAKDSSLLSAPHSAIPQQVE